MNTTSMAGGFTGLLSSVARPHSFNPRKGQTPILSDENNLHGAQRRRWERIRGELLQAGLAGQLRALNVVTAEEIVGFFGAVCNWDMVGAALGAKPDQVRKIIGGARRLSIKATVGQYNQALLDSFPAKLSEETVEELAKHLEAVQRAALVLPRSHKLTGYNLSPIRHQGQRGTCVSMVACYLLEQAILKSGGNYRVLSPQYHFWKSKAHDRFPSRDETIPEVGFAVLKLHGTCLESEWPYSRKLDPLVVTHQPPLDVLKNQVSLHRAGRALKLENPRDLPCLKALLSENHAIAVTIPVYASWDENANIRLTGNIPLPYETSHCGVHAVALVGFGDHPDFAGGGYFIIRNSWGKTWGRQSRWGRGYGTIPYAFLEHRCRAAFIVEPENAPPTGESLSGNTKAQ